MCRCKVHDNKNIFIIGQFDDMGVAEGKIDTKYGKVKVLRLRVHEESENWAILSEVCTYMFFYI